MEIRRQAMFLMALNLTLFGSLGVCLLAQPAYGATLKPETVRAFETYVQAVEKKLDAALVGQGEFLSVNASPAEKARVLNGELLIKKSSAIPDFDVPSGLIHDWTGTVFIPCGVEKVLAVLRDVDRYKQIYPEVVDSRLLDQSGDSLRTYIRLKKTKVITVVLNTEYQVRFLEAGDGGGRHMRSHSVKIAEVEHPGTPEEAEKPQGDDTGLLWRLFAYWQLMPVPGGTLVECRAVSLTRGIPFALSWIVGPFVNSVPRESLASTLECTKRAALGSPSPQAPVSDGR